MNLRLGELVTSGDLRNIQQVKIELTIRSPPDSDPRWSLELAGGATMDLGCYVIKAARQVGRWLEGAPSVVSAEVSLKEPGVDAAMRVELANPSGIPAKLHLGHERRGSPGLDCLWDNRDRSRAVFCRTASGQPDHDHTR